MDAKICPDCGEMLSNPTYPDLYHCTNPFCGYWESLGIAHHFVLGDPPPYVHNAPWPVETAAQAEFLISELRSRMDALGSALDDSRSLLAQLEEVLRNGKQS